VDDLKGVGSGFVAGTLVHTDRGLVPIERIKVGDLVLSTPENGLGEREYKRVLKTHVYEDKEIRAIEYYIVRSEDQTHPDEGTLYITDIDPFWVKDEGWTGACHLEPGMELELANGALGVVSKTMFVVDTQYPEIGLVIDHDYPDHTTCVEFGPEGPVSFAKDKRYEAGRRKKRRVYNLEVEDFHTCYVDDAGVWVHDQSPKPRVDGPE
jgi:hypothetical protein